MTEPRSQPAERAWIERLLSQWPMRSGSRLHTARAYVLSLLYEWPRVLAWKRRHDQQTGKTYSWARALQATVQNPPNFDRMWDKHMEPTPNDDE